jgi:hypothetical protein
MNRVIATSVAALLAFAGTASAQFFMPSNIVVSRVGDGTTTLSNASTQVSLLEFLRTGSATGQVVDFNIGAGTRLVNSGSATSEGYLSSTFDQRYILNAGYDAAVGTASVASTANPAAPTAGTRRVVAVTDTWTGAVSYTTFDGTFSGNNIRSAAASVITGPTSTLYMAGTAGSGQGATGGVRSGLVSGGSTTQLSGATVTNFRNVKVVNFGGSDVVVASSQSGAATGLNLITGSDFVNFISTTTIANNSVYDFFFANDRTVYLADDRAAGGLFKLTRTGGVAGDIATGTWSTVYSVAVPTTTGTTGIRGLAGEVVAGQVNLFAVTAESGINRLVSYSEALGATSASSFTTLASSGSNFAFRGVTIVPTPGAAALLGLGGLLAARRRRA